MQEVPRGELGYREWSVHLIGLGHCSCDGCGGHLEDGVCISCGCGHHIQGPTRSLPEQYAAWIPVAESGRCADADASREAERREHDRLERLRMERMGGTDA